MKLNYYEHSSKLSKHYNQLVILLHGYGSNGTDLISLAPELEDTLPNAIFISPDAPFPFEGGFQGGFQWYSLLDRRPIIMLEDAKKAEKILKAFIKDQLKRTNIDISNLIVIGFSQGGMMALYSMLQHDNQALAVISFSGYLVDNGKLLSEVKSKPPILLTHGLEDTIVPPKSFHFTLNLLQDIGCNVESLLVPGLGHGIDYNCIQKAILFLKKHINK